MHALRSDDGASEQQDEIDLLLMHVAQPETGQQLRHATPSHQSHHERNKDLQNRARSPSVNDHMDKSFSRSIAALYTWLNRVVCSLLADTTFKQSVLLVLLFKNASNLDILPKVSWQIAQLVLVDKQSVQVCDVLLLPASCLFVHPPQPNALQQVGMHHSGGLSLGKSSKVTILNAVRPSCKSSHGPEWLFEHFKTLAEPLREQHAKGSSMSNFIKPDGTVFASYCQVCLTVFTV